MRKIGIMMSVLALCGGTAFSQSLLDAYRYSQTELNGTARVLGMGGAFGALGGDISVMNANPAGLAVYHSSEVVTTFSLSAINAKSNWLGNQVKEGKNTFNFDNIAYVGYFPTGNDEGLVSWNVGFSYNRVKNYRRNYTLNTSGNLHTSLSEYVAVRSFGLPASDLSGTDNYDPYSNSQNDWLSVLGFQGGYTIPQSNDESVYSSAFYDPDNQEYLNLQGAELRVSEWGSVDRYNMAFGLNISEFLMLGADVSITDLKYEYESGYDEGFDRSSSLYLDIYSISDGTGFSFNIGAIVRPVDFLRFGVAYNSPVWYKMTDYYQGHAGTNIPFLSDPEFSASTPDGAYYDYEYRTPDKWLFSAAAILGTVGLISVDYELSNYKNMRMYQSDGSSDIVTNGDISDNFKIGNTVRVGAEFKPTPQFAVRAGVAYSDSPYKDPIKNGNVEIATAGTLPHYTMDKGLTSYSVGLGYRFTPNFYTDLACVFSSRKEDAYVFSSMMENGTKILEAQPATLKTNTTRVALTLGYKF